MGRSKSVEECTLIATLFNHLLFDVEGLILGIVATEVVVPSAVLVYT